MRDPGEKRRVLFVENREKTWLWAGVARELIRKGCHVEWLVQNPFFTPPKGSGKVHVIPFPRRGDLRETQDPETDFPILVTERGRQYFDAGSSHYAYYWAAIQRVFDLARPDIAIGETTLFHELLAVQAARDRGIAYVQPAGERYQNDRFMIFDGISQDAYVRNCDVMDGQAAVEFARGVLERNRKPSYMVSRNRLAERIYMARWATSRARVWAARLAGEKFNTPSLKRKRVLARQTAQRIAGWRELQSTPAPGEVSVMFPLQMQPEANIDVWGRPFSDQLDLVRRMASAAPRNVSISVKANPKAKYEITPELLEYAASASNVRLLPFDMSMDEARTHCTGAVTVCGTVGFEAVFGRGRCVSLRHSLLETEFPTFAASTPEEAVRKIVEDPQAGQGGLESGTKLVAELFESTFPGYIVDPFNFPEVMEPDNLRQIATGLEVAIDRAIEEKRVAASTGSGR